MDAKTEETCSPHIRFVAHHENICMEGVHKSSICRSLHESIIVQLKERSRNTSLLSSPPSFQHSSTFDLHDTPVVPAYDLLLYNTGRRKHEGLDLSFGNELY